MKNYDVIIIGGGLGGLTAGAKLAKEGKKVLLIEQHYIPGGCATTFKRKDYIMEVGLHELDGFD
jgi:all-trans-retinol 13,14-reductase